MTGYETITLTFDGPFAHLTLNRPRVKNAMNAQMIRELTAAFEALASRSDARAVVLAGADGTFCAGGDLQELAAAAQDPAHDPLHDAQQFDALLQAVQRAPQVVVARVEGAALGGGFGLVCVSDIAVAAATAKMGLPEVRLGLVPALIAPYVVARTGPTRARELMLSGRRFDGVSAHEYGIVHDVCPPEVLDVALKRVLDDLRQCAPVALAACKRLLLEVTNKPPADTLTYRADLLRALRRSAEGQEGMLAFASRRPPGWAQ